MNNAEAVTPRSRISAACGSGVPDRVPVLTYSNHFQLRWAGYSYGEVMREGEKFVEAQIAAWDHFGYDGVTGLGGPGMVADALGAKLLVPEYNSPSMTEPGLTENRGDVDIEGLHFQDLRRNDFIQFSLEVTRKLKEALSPGVPLIAAISSPFREAALLRGFERLFIDIAEDPKFAEELIELTMDRVYEFAKLAAESGADILGLTDPFASKSMISRSRYRNIVFPYEKELVERIQEETEAMVLFHTCGQWGDRFDLAIRAGADIYHIDGIGDMNLREVTERYGDSAAIMGRLSTTELLLHGEPEEVCRAARESIAAAAEAGNYILGGNCSLAPDTPPKNLEAAVAAAKKYGTYPLEEFGIAGPGEGLCSR